MIADVQKKSAIPILSGMTPRNYWGKSNKTLQSTWPFTEYARQQAAASKIEFVDHTKFSVSALQALGASGAKKLFPQDNTHTNDAGAVVMAETFVQGVVCGKSVLGGYLNAKGKGVKAGC
jgi:rhamnogalacturonan acetylesterase